jgi:hypothetical protein
LVILLSWQSSICEVFWSGSTNKKFVYQKIINSWGVPVTVEVYKKGDTVPLSGTNKTQKKLERKLSDGRTIIISYEKAFEAHLFAKP